MPPHPPAPARGIRRVGTPLSTSLSQGVPVNDVQKALGHERASTTLDRYTHGSDGQDKRVRAAFADDSLTSGTEVIEKKGDGDAEQAV
jgi:integrase